MQQSPALKIQVFAALLIVQILFGVNYVVSKVIVKNFPPLVWASVRIGCAAILLLLIALFTKRKRHPFKKSFIKPLIFFAFLGVIIPQGSFLVGLKYTTASNSAILNTLIPIFTLLIVTLNRVEPLSLLRFLGFLSAFTGVLVLRKYETISFSDKTALGDGLTIISCLSLSLFFTLSRKFVQKYDPIWTTAGFFSIGTIGLTLLSIPSWMTFHLPILSWELFGCFCFSIIGGTLLAYLLNLWALARTRSSSVALAIYLQPIISSTLAWYYLGEQITIRMIFSGLLIFFGMLLSLRS